MEPSTKHIPLFAQIFLNIWVMFIVFRIEVLLFGMNYKITPYKKKLLPTKVRINALKFIIRALTFQNFDKCLFKKQYNRQIVVYHCYFNLHLSDYLVVGLFSCLLTLHFLSNSYLYSLFSFPVDYSSLFTLWRIFLHEIILPFGW